jgi:hypothetical protein
MFHIVYSSVPSILAELISCSPCAITSPRMLTANMRENGAMPYHAASISSYYSRSPAMQASAAWIKTTAHPMWCMPQPFNSLAQQCADIMDPAAKRYMMPSGIQGSEQLSHSQHSHGPQTMHNRAQCALKPACCQQFWQHACACSCAFRCAMSAHGRMATTSSHRS